MKVPEKPANENERLRALEMSGMLYTPTEARFDRIVRLATKVFNVRTAVISLVAENCQWFKATEGLATKETPRQVSFCGHAILSDDVFVVPDTLNDPRFFDNPLVTGSPFIRFYAGQPIFSQDGLKLGTLCLINPYPRRFSEEDKDALRDMAVWVENEMNAPKLGSSQLSLIETKTSEERKVLIDPVTSSWNKDGMKELLAREIRAHEESKSSFSVLVCECAMSLQKLPLEAGDTNVVLQEILRRLKNHARPVDIIGRIDDGIFMIVFPQHDQLRIEILREKLRASLLERPIIIGEHACGIDIGFSLEIYIPGSGLDAQGLLEGALAHLKQRDNSSQT